MTMKTASAASCLYRLTWKTETLHLVSMAAAQSFVKPLEVRVSACDDGWSLITATSLDHMDGVELEGHRRNSLCLYKTAASNFTMTEVC